MTRPTNIQWLLEDVCVRLGFCLPPNEQIRLEQDPPKDVDAFTDAIFVAEGLDPHEKSNRGLRAQVRELVAKHLKPQ